MHTRTTAARKTHTHANLHTPRTDIHIHKQAYIHTNTHTHTDRHFRIWELLKRDIDEFILLWEFHSCPCRRQNQDWVCVSLQRGGHIGCKASKVRSKCDGLSCLPNHPRSPPYRDFDASCKTSRLRAQKRLTPWPEGWVFAQSPVLQDVSKRTSEFFIWTSKHSGRWGKQGQRSGRRHCGSCMAGQGCGAHGVRALRLLHRATQGGKQGHAQAVRCRDLAYQRCHIDMCRGRPGALVSDGRALSRLLTLFRPFTVEKGRMRS